jgi:hypothetical protein
MERVLPANVRRGRRVLAWMAGVFVLVQLSAGLLLDYRWPWVRWPSSARALACLKGDRPGGPDIVFMGSSRFGSCIRADVVQPRLRARTADRLVQVVNASVPAADGYAADYLLKQALAAGSRPALLIVEVAPENLGVLNRFVQLHVQRQVAWHQVPEIAADACMCGQLLRLLQARTLPLHLHRREICRNVWGWLVGQVDNMCFSVPDTEPPQPPQPTANPAVRELQQAAADMIANWLKDYRPCGIAARSLEHLLGRCAARGIAVVLVAPPVCSIHRQQYTEAVNAQFLDYMARLRQCYGCQFVDCRDRLADDLLIDTHHASATGGWYFSRQLTDTLLVPLWQQHLRKAR